MALDLKGNLCVVWFEERPMPVEEVHAGFPVFLDGMDDQDGHITELIDAGYVPVSHSAHVNPNSGGTSWSVVFFRDPVKTGLSFP